MQDSIDANGLSASILILANLSRITWFLGNNEFVLVWNWLNGDILSGVTSNNFAFTEPESDAGGTTQ